VARNGADEDRFSQQTDISVSSFLSGNNLGEAKR
jgi:hypothetical protein